MQRHFPETVATVVWILSGLFLYISSAAVTVLSLSAFLGSYIRWFSPAAMSHRPAFALWLGISPSCSVIPLHVMVVS